MAPAGPLFVEVSERMRTLKLSLVALVPAALVACSLAGPSLAGEVKAPAADQGRKVARVKSSPCWDKLGLTDKQKTALQALNQKFRLKAQELRKSSKTEDQKKAEFKKLAEARKAETGKVLTKQQQEKLRECMKTQSPKWGGARAPGAAKKPKAPASSK